ncbi:MAG: hypothetical protein IPK65_03330 [Gammaproteobacteria bacterium]|nr:hypothetical protein [Gammaproteobacteria bacterium]
MGTFKSLILGIVTGLIVGLWFGVNIGKGRDFYANPFAGKDLTGDLMESSGEMLEKGGKALKDMNKD